MTDVRLTHHTVMEALELVRAGDEAAACALLTEAIGDTLSRPATPLDVARMFWNAQHHDEAVRVYFHAQTDDDDLEITTELAQKLFQLRRWDELYVIAKILNEQDPTESYSYNYLAWSSFELDKTGECRAVIEKGLSRARNGVDFQAGVLARIDDGQMARIKAAHERRAADIVSRHAGDGGPRITTWRADPVGETTARLLGATTGLGDGEIPFFELAPTGVGAAPGRIAATAVAKGGVCVWRGEAESLTPGTEYEARLLCADPDSADPGSGIRFRTGKAAPADVVTADGLRAGNDGAVLAGTVGGTTRPTRVHFEWGYAEDALDNRTEPQWAPPAKTCRIDQQVVDGLAEWLFYAVEQALIEDGDGRDDPGSFAIRLTTPFGKDRNHLDGIGIADLLAGWYGRWLTPDGAPASGRAQVRDLRDAEVSLRVRPHGLDARDFLFACNTQSYTGREAGPGVNESSAWTLTDQLVDFRDLDDGAWTTLEFTFPSAPRAWTYCANNPAEQGNAERYGYAPIDRVLSAQRGNLWFWFVLGDWRDPPKGAIDLRSIGLSYRNWSILAPHMGATLIGYPTGGIADPGRLTAGWLGNPDEMWFSEPDPDQPQEFVWRLGAEARPTLLRIHQNPMRPARSIELLGSTDGATYRSLARFELVDIAFPEPAMPTDLVLPGEAVTYLKLVVRSGHHSDFWGLDAIEVFDDDAEPHPEVAPASVSAELDGLQPGRTIHCRLVAENSAGRTEGPVRSIGGPAGDGPSILGARCLHQTAERVTLLAETVPGGRPSRLHARVTGPGGASSEGTVDIGSNRGLRQALIAVDVDGDGDAGAFGAELTAANDGGTSEPCLLEWEPGGD